MAKWHRPWWEHVPDISYPDFYLKTCCGFDHNLHIEHPASQTQHFLTRLTAGQCGARHMGGQAINTTSMVMNSRAFSRAVGFFAGVGLMAPYRCAPLSIACMPVNCSLRCQPLHSGWHGWLDAPRSCSRDQCHQHCWEQSTARLSEPTANIAATKQIALRNAILNAWKMSRKRLLIKH